jgi:hypothetical protein
LKCFRSCQNSGNDLTRVWEIFMKIAAIHPSQFAKRTGFSKLEKPFLLQKSWINTPESTLFNSSTPQY